MESPDSPPVAEFLFGTLSSPEGRAEHVRAAATGLRHGDAIDPADPEPGQPVTVRVRVGTDLDVAAVLVAYRTDGGTPAFPRGSPRGEPGGEPGAAGDSVVALTRASVAWNTAAWGYVEEWAGVIPGQPEGTLVRYAVAARARDGRWLDAPHTAAGGDRRVYAYHVDRLAIPDWIRDAVLYHAVVDRFAPDPGADFAPGRTVHEPHGGTLRGLAARLDYLADLGVTALWLTPITPCPSYHGYDPTDLGTVEPRLGTEQDWEHLAAGARRRGLRLVLDFVANHVSDRHPAFAAAVADAASPFVPWFRFTAWPHDYQGFFALKSMPILDTGCAAAREHLVEQAAAWLRRGCDGFRLDHAHGPGPSFWAEFRARLRAVRPDAVLLGEITEPPDALRTYAGRMDGVLDFALAEALRGFFARDRLTPTAFAAWLDRHFAYFGRDLVLASFLDNHDMSRFLWLTQGDRARLRLAALCQFTLPGPPIVYYGTEVGLGQVRPLETLDESRLPMPWGEGRDEGLLEFYRALIRLRRRAPAAWREGPKVREADDARGFVSYACGPYTVVLNHGAADVVVRQGRVLLATGDDVRALGGSLVLPPRSGAVVE